MANEKFCINCKHINVPKAGLEFARCALGEDKNSQNYRNWLVTNGDPESRYSYCTSMRDPSQPCGLDAKLFEAANPLS